MTAIGVSDAFEWFTSLTKKEKGKDTRLLLQLLRGPVLTESLLCTVVGVLWLCRRGAAIFRELGQRVQPPLGREVA